MMPAQSRSCLYESGTTLFWNVSILLLLMKITREYCLHRASTEQDAQEQENPHAHIHS
jgi:hypothetical protein